MLNYRVRLQSELLQIKLFIQNNYYKMHVELRDKCIIILLTTIRLFDE